MLKQQGAKSSPLPLLRLLVRDLLLVTTMLGRWRRQHPPQQIIEPDPAWLVALLAARRVLLRRRL
jgi:hypothetical protein